MQYSIHTNTNILAEIATIEAAIEGRHSLEVGKS